jgi:hypothetical protein
MQNKGFQARLQVLYEIHKIGFIVVDNGDLPILGLLCLTTISLVDQIIAHESKSLGFDYHN